MYHSSLKRLCGLLSLCAAIACGDDADANGTMAGMGGGPSAGTAGGAMTAVAMIQASTTIGNPAPQLAGSGTLSEASGAVTFSVNVTGCPQGQHGLHIHAGTECGADGAAAMGHWDPAMAGVHGQVGEAAPHHAGDVGVLDCAASGNAALSLTTDEWSMAAGAANNPVGQAVILHGVDPAQRIACGVIGADGSFTLAPTTLSENPASTLAGTATFSQETDGQVTVALALTGCPEGNHGFHIHAGTSCGADGSEAMGHWDPTMAGVHGQVGEAAPHHAGDVGVVACGADGTGNLTLTTSEWTLSEAGAPITQLGKP